MSGPGTAPGHIAIAGVGDDIAAADRGEVRAVDRGPITDDPGGIIYGSGRDAVRCALGSAGQVEVHRAARILRDGAEIEGQVLAALARS